MAAHPEIEKAGKASSAAATVLKSAERAFWLVKKGGDSALIADAQSDLNAARAAYEIACAMHSRAISKFYKGGALPLGI